MTEYAFEGAKRASTAISWSVATVNYRVDATTPFSTILSAPYVATVSAAFARWAGVSPLTFTQVPDSVTVPIRVGFGLFPTSAELGETDYRPSGGVLGNDTLIRLLDPYQVPVSAAADGTLYYTQYGATVYQVALHEIGHALGLDHTTDPATIMYPYVGGTNTDLAAGDIIGINTLYPHYTIQALNPIQSEGASGQVTNFDYVITRFSDPALGLTLDYAVTGTASARLAGSVAAGSSAFLGGAYPAGQITFAPGATTVTLTIATIGNATPQPDQGFTFSLTNNDGSALSSAGPQGGLILDDDGYGRVSAATLPIYRFFDTQDGTHFYSANEAERNALIATRPDLSYEGVGLNAIANPSNDPAAAAVFRFFDRGNGTHVYSTSVAERDGIVATRPDLVAEGTAFYEHAAAQPGDQAVYRFFSRSDGAHFYTSSATERAAVASTRPDLIAEGVAFYAPSA